MVMRRENAFTLVLHALHGAKAAAATGPPSHGGTPTHSRSKITFFNCFCLLKFHMEGLSGFGRL